MELDSICITFDYCDSEACWARKYCINTTVISCVVSSLPTCLQVKFLHLFHFSSFWVFQIILQCLFPFSLPLPLSYHLWMWLFVFMAFHIAPLLFTVHLCSTPSSKLLCGVLTPTKFTPKTDVLHI